MNSANGRARLSATLDASFSFYVTASKQTRIRQAAHFGDAVTVAGPKGPEVISKLRVSGFDRPVLFDGMGYAGKEHVPATWVRVCSIRPAPTVPCYPASTSRGTSTTPPMSDSTANCGSDRRRATFSGGRAHAGTGIPAGSSHRP